MPDDTVQHDSVLGVEHAVLRPRPRGFVFDCATRATRRTCVKERHRRITQIRTYVHACMRACKHACVTSHTYVRTYIHTYIHIHACMHACMHIYMHTYVRTYTDTYAYVQTSIHDLLVDSTAPGSDGRRKGGSKGGSVPFFSSAIHSGLYFASTSDRNHMNLRILRSTPAQRRCE